MSEQDEMTEERAHHISEGIDTAFHFLQQAFFENPDLLADVASGSIVVLERELERAASKAESGNDVVIWVPDRGDAQRVRRGSPRRPHQG
jgi:hypothetical protein